MNEFVKKFDIIEAKKRCLEYRKRILDISQTVTALHAAGAFSAMEMVDCIYFGLMKKNDSISINNSPDTFLMSKGHSCIVQYVILEKMGILKEKDINAYCKPEGFLGCHPDYGVPGIEASTGSLGHGMALAVGMAQADRIQKIERKVFIVISDGELQEGSTWEAMMMAANLATNNIICLLDHNGSQSFGHTIETHPKFYPIREKVESFGWEVEEVNGHSAEKVYDAVNKRSKKKPFMLIGNTVKGKGVSFMENQPIWHYRSPTSEEYAQAIKNLKEIDS